MKRIPILSGTLLVGAVFFAVYENRQARRTQAELHVCEQELAKIEARLAQRSPAAAPNSTAVAIVPQNQAASPGQIATPPGAASGATLSDARPGSGVPQAPQGAEKNAEMQRREAALHRRYDAFFRQRGLTTAQTNRFIELMMEQQDARSDLQAAVRNAGIAGDNPVVEDERSQLYQPATQGLHDLLGDDGYAAYAAYEKASYYQQAFVQPIMPGFSAAGAALTDAQTEQMVRIVAANDHPVRLSPSDVGSESRIDWDSVLAEAAGILTPPQRAVLQSWANLQKQKQPVASR